MRLEKIKFETERERQRERERVASRKRVITKDSYLQL